VTVEGTDERVDEVATDEAAATEPAHRRSGGRVRQFLRLCFPTTASIVLACLVCVAAPVTMVAIHIHENPMFSPIDEAAHFDYVNRIAQGDVPRLGQPMLSTTLRTVACRGSALPGAVQPPCTVPVIHPDQFGGGGLSYEAQQPPAYYAITAPLRWLAVHVVGLSPLSGTRAIGALWLAVGLLLLWAAGRVLRLDPKVIGAVVLLVAISPAVIYESSIVTNTASMIFMGSLVALTGALAYRYPGRWVPPTLFAVGVLAAAAKETGALAAVVVAVMFAIYTYVQRPATESRATAAWAWFRRWLPNGGALAIGAVLTVIAWSIISRQLSLITPKTLPSLGVLRGYPVGVALIAREATTLLTPATGSFDPFRSNNSATVPATSALAQHLQTITGLLLGYLFIAGGAAGLFVRRRQWNHWLGLLSLPALFVGGIVLGVGIWLTYDADPGLSGRYGLPLLPFLALALVASARGKWVLGGLWTVAVGLCGLDFFYLLAR
jgi:hypothetical protein